MSPASTDPEKRARQLANLRPGAGAGRIGQAPNLKHGGRSRSPQRSPEWSPAVRLAADDLAARVGDELRDGGGELLPWAVPSVEAVAVLRVALARVDRWAADREARGTYTGQDDVIVSGVAAKYHAALEREALTLRSRIDAQGQAFDLAQHWASTNDGEAGGDD